MGAGYGRYFRKTCQTDSHGRSKYHYCAGSDPATACITDQLPPHGRFCEEFFKANNTPATVPDGVEEIILRYRGRPVSYCYKDASPDPKSKGWCRVDKDATTIQVLKKSDSWGFCSKDCYLSETEKMSQVLRAVRGVDILSDMLCNVFLRKSLKNNRAIVMPQILCIGHLERFKYQSWNIIPNPEGLRAKGGLEFAPEPKRRKWRRFKHKDEMIPGSGAYVRAAGTCNGDSGGPVFIKEDNSGLYVVLGAVSGGRGRLSNCGGINNPTHYVRLKFFGKWIQNALGAESEQLCFM